MMSSEFINPNPVVYEVQSIERRPRAAPSPSSSSIGSDYEDFDDLEVFDIIRNINDPEHPLTLEQLKVVQHEHIKIDNIKNRIQVFFTPTIPHCSMATLIGLCIRVKLLRSLPSRFKVDIFVWPGSHQSEESVNKQLNDKERVAAALENSHLLGVVNKCITDSGGYAE